MGEKRIKRKREREEWHPSMKSKSGEDDREWITRKERTILMQRTLWLVELLLCWVWCPKTTSRLFILTLIALWRTLLFQVLVPWSSSLASSSYGKSLSKEGSGTKMEWNGGGKRMMMIKERRWAVRVRRFSFYRMNVVFMLYLLPRVK